MAYCFDEAKLTPEERNLFTIYSNTEKKIIFAVKTA